MFIDFVALLLLNMTAGLLVLCWFLLRGLTSEDNKALRCADDLPSFTVCFR